MYPSAENCNSAAENCSSTEVLPPAAQRMEPSRTPGQDCQGEQVPASAMKAIVNQ
jgi:hypothetical protein